MLPRVDLDRLSSADLKALVIQLMETVAALEERGARIGWLVVRSWVG
jgi:hypothetical protein